MAVKKSSKKKVSNKKTVKKKGLQKAPTDSCFYIVDGTCCADILQLSDAIDNMADEVFNHHVCDDNNDFANWVEHVFGEKDLAEKIREKKDKDHHVKSILRVVVEKLK